MNNGKVVEFNMAPNVSVSHLNRQLSGLVSKQMMDRQIFQQLDGEAQDQSLLSMFQNKAVAQ